MEPSAYPRGLHDQLCTLVTGASTNEAVKIDAAWTKIEQPAFTAEQLRFISRHAPARGVCP
jgi:hypothetical protein